MAIISRHRLFSVVAGIIILAGAGFSLFWFSYRTEAEADNSKWKNFSETEYGLSMDYLGNWSFGASYDRYAKGLIDVALSNRKCQSIVEGCSADCVDIRVLAGKTPEGSSPQALFVQLYEDLLAVKDTNNPELVQKMDIGGKTVYKVLAEGPTLSMNGKCGGPLYIFETRAGYFAYVFTGLGSNAANASKDMIEKMIASIDIKGKQ